MKVSELLGTQGGTPGCLPPGALSVPPSTLFTPSGHLVGASGPSSPAPSVVEVAGSVGAVGVGFECFGFDSYFYVMTGPEGDGGARI